ncbi:MAG: ATP-binding protein [Tepidisphaeraceae bacterium]
MRSFRVRLIIAFVALFAAISVAVSFIGLMLREQQIRSVFDRELLTRADEVSRTLDSESKKASPDIATAVTEVTSRDNYRFYYIQVTDADGRVVATSPSLPRQGFPLETPVKDAVVDGVVRELKLKGGDVIRALPSELRGLFLRADIPTGGHPYTILVATAAQAINENQTTLRYLFVGGNFGGLLAAAGAAWLVTGAMSRRIESIKSQVQRVGPDELSRRIESPDRDEISELATHLNAMLDRLKAGFETQERFIHDASHELKTPIATVQAEAQALMLGESSKEELLDFVRSTNDEMRRLGRLTEALLLLTRSNEAKVAQRLRTMDMTEITISAIRHLSALATDHRVQLNLVQPGEHEPLLIRCDPDLLEAMISNLIRNAIRFSPQRSEVRITLGSNADSVELMVEDSGPGIPADILPRIFDRYFQSSQTRVRRGAGLGLAIAMTVVNLHGGSISASNRTSTHGACFTVRLPLLPASSTTHKSSV